MSFFGPGTLETTTLNGGLVYFTNPGIGVSASGSICSAENARIWVGVRSLRIFLAWRDE